MNSRHIYVLFACVVVFGVFGIAPHAYAALTYVGGASATGNSAAFSVSLTGLTGGSNSSPSQGDIVIVSDAYNGTANGNPGVGTAGYTEVVDSYINGTTYDANLSVSWKIMGASPDTTVSCNGSGSATKGAVCTVQVWRGADQTTPMDVASTTASATATAAPNAPAITPVTSGAVVIAIGTRADSAADTAVTAPTGYSNQVNNGIDPSVAESTAMASKAWSGSGSEDPAVWTGWTTAANGSWAAATIALRPAATASAYSVAGSLYSDAGSTKVTDRHHVIKVAVASTSATLFYSATTSTSTGAWSVSLPGRLATGTIITAWVDSDPAITGSLVTAASGTSTITGVDLYKNYVVLGSTGSNHSFTLNDLATYDARSRDSIGFVSLPDSGTLFIPKGLSLYVKSGNSFTASTTNILGGGITNNGTLDLSAGNTYFGSDGTVSGSGSGNALGNTYVGSSTALRINDGVQWATASSGTATGMESLAYGNGIFAATSWAGKAMRSTNYGSTWSMVTAAEGNAWRGMTYGNGLFVAVSSDGTHRVMTSPDGNTWTARTAAAANYWTSVAYGNGLYVAVSQDGTSRVMTSSDGTTWTSRTAAEANSWHNVTYGNGLFVAVSTDGTHRVMTSPDGITWTARTAAAAVQWTTVTYGNGLFVAGSWDGNVMTSQDGITWTSRTPAESNSWQSSLFANGLFALIASTGTYRVQTSADGITWVPHTMPEANSYYAIGYGNNTLVALSGDGTHQVMVSTSTVPYTVSNFNTNGITWTSKSTTGYQWSEVAYGEGRFVAVSWDGQIMVSEDGLTWRGVTAPTTNALYGATYGNGQFVVVGDNYIATSPDGITWTNRTSPEHNWWGDVAYGNGRYVAAGSLNLGSHSVITSPDGVTWTTATIAENDSFQGLTFGNGLFVAVATDGTLGQIATSPDGITWTFHNSPQYNAWDSVTYGNGIYVAVAYSGTYPIMRSTDGITWATSSPAVSNTWRDVKYANGLFVAVGSGTTTSQFMTSPDGITWTARSAPQADSWWGITYGEDTWVAVANTGSSRAAVSTTGSFASSTLTFSSNATTSDLMNYASSTLTAPSSLTITGDYTNNGTFNANNGTIYASSSASEVLSGTLTGTNALNDVVFKGSGSKTFSNNASTSAFTINTSAAVIAPSKLTVGGDFTNNGSFDNNNGTLYLSGADANISGSFTGSSSLNTVIASSSRHVVDISTWSSETAAEANAWLSVTYGNGTFVAIAFSGTHQVMTSSDGITWTARTAAEANGWNAVTYGNGLFVAVSTSGTHRVMTSSDGITWTARTAASASTWNAITYGNGLFVAVGASGAVMTSSDGITWTSRTAAEANTWNGVVYGNGLYVAVAGSGTHRVMTSSDAITWSTQTAAEANSWKSVTYGDGLYVAVGSSGTHQVMTSPDGSTWTAQSAPNTNGWYSVTYGGGYYVAIAYSNGAGNEIMTSPDGSTWTAQSTPEIDSWNSVTYGNGTFVAVAYDGTYRVMKTAGSAIATSTMTFENNASTTNLTIQGTYTKLVAPAALTVEGNYTNSALFDSNGGTLYASSSASQTFAGTMTGSSTFNDISFYGSGTKTFSNNASTSDFTIATSSTVVAPSKLSIRGNFANHGTFTSGSGSVYFLGNTTAVETPVGTWDVTSAVYDGAGKSVSSQETQVTALAFKPDGTKMYIDGYNSDAVNSYTLSTPWDVTTASHDASSFSTLSQDTFVEKIAFSDDGTKMYALGSGNDKVYEYTLSTAWDITTASYSNFFSVGTQDGSPFGLEFKPDGTRMYIAGDSNDKIFSYTLSTPWDVTTASYDSKSFSISGQQTSVQDVAFSDDGTKMFAIGYTNDYISPYTLSTPWDVTTASYDGSSFSVSSQESSPDGAEFKPDGTKVFVHGESSGAILPYTLSTGTSTSYTGTSSISGTLTGSSHFNNVVIDAPRSLNPDGATWDQATSSEANAWDNIIYAKGLFVAISYNGTDRVMTSPDGITWTARSAASASSWNGIAYGNGTFVAVGGGGEVMTSPDGITWTSRTASEANEWNAVTYGNGVFVAVSTAGTHQVMTSPDGITWTNRTAAAANIWVNVEYGGGLFVAVSNNGTNEVMTSQDGITWTSRTAPGTSWYGLAYGNGTWVATAYDDVMTSPDGINWTDQSGYPAYSWQSVGYGNGLFVAVADGTAAFMTSPDGVTWTERSVSEANSWWDIVFGDNRFVAVAQNGTHRVQVSSSGSFAGNVVLASNASTSDLTIQDGSNLLAPSKLSIAGNYSNDGSVDWGSGTTTFNGTGAQTATGTMTGTSAFKNLVVSNTVATTTFSTSVQTSGRFTAVADATIAFPDGATSTFATVKLDGTSGNEIKLRSTSAGTQWGFSPTVVSSITYVDVKDSTACNGAGGVTATSSIDSGNNTCWTFVGGGGATSSVSISSAVNQTFSLSGATTTAATITVTDGSPAAITAANDLRITIDTAKTDMRFDTSITSATFSGTAAGKVSGSLTYENNGATVVIPVSSDFAAGDTLTIAGVKFAQFGAINAATSTLSVSSGGQAIEGGATWTAHTGVATTWAGIGYGSSTFVAVGLDSAMTSSDGSTWTSRSIPTGLIIWQSVAYGSSTFVAVGPNVFGGGSVATSPDGITWTSQTPAEANSWESVVYGNGLFVAVAKDGTHRVMTSPDGITWTARTDAEANTWKSVTYGGGLFVAVSSDGTHRVMTSSDGITWTARTGVANQWSSVTYGNGLFVAVSPATSTSQVMTSSDGITWTARTASDAVEWNSVTYGGGTFVAVSCGEGVPGNCATNTSGDRIMTSTDGITWTAHTAVGDGGSVWFAVTYGGGLFAAVGDYSDTGGDGYVMTSPGGSSGGESAADDKTVAITGSLALADSDAGQVSNVFSFQNKTAQPVFAFKMTPAGENANISSLAFDLTGINNIDSSNFSNFKLYRDYNGNGAVDAGDTQVGGSASVLMAGENGTVTFSSAFSATTSLNYVLIADTTAIHTNAYVTIGLVPTKTNAVGGTTDGTIPLSGSVTSVQHIRSGGGGASEIGNSAPQGAGVVTGGSSGGGGSAGDSDATGQSIGSEAGFLAPSVSGSANNEWTGGNNALASDGAYATAASANLRQSYSVFGFNVPNSDSVTGIAVKLEASAGTAAGTIQVGLSWDGGNSITAVKATSVLTTSDAVYTLGGASDLWGRSWSASELGDANFFVRVIAQPNGNTVKVDAIQVRPYHQAAGGGGGGGGEI